MDEQESEKTWRSELSQSRTKNVSRNAIVAFLCQIINLFLNFLIRTVFIKVLGAEYLGVNGLFTNILTVLSFAELGIGNAIVFNLYKPLALDDKERIKSLMLLYRKSYSIIGIIVSTVGLMVVPFLNYIIKEKPDIPENIVLLYILFLTNTSISYFFVYKKNIIIADQRNCITVIISQISIIVKTVFQIIFLYLTHEFVIYLVIQIVFTFIENMMCSIIANRLYPYIKEHANKLEMTETKKIFADVRALAIYKFGSVILNGTDNILISALLGVRDVGLASNYILLTTSCQTLLGRIVEVFESSVGNLNATEGPEKQYDIFKKIHFLTSWIFGFASVGLILVAQQFIKTWVGEDYILPYIVLVAIVLEFYVKGAHSVCYTYRTTLGLFVKGRWSAMMAAIINIFLSICLCKFIGLAGIFIATPISRIVSIGVVDSTLIFRRVFRKRVLEYYLRCLMYISIFGGIGGICYWIISKIDISGWLGVGVNIVVVSIVFNLLIIAIFCRTKEFKEILKMVKKVIGK